jgi:3-oxoacyl-[acyl-carrier protein] reductase
VALVSERPVWVSPPLHRATSPSRLSLRTISLQSHLNKMSLTGKVAIVTGGSRGIGAGIAKELAARGAAVLITYVSRQDAADEVVSDIRARGGTAACVKADCVDKEGPGVVVEAALQFNKGIDIIINNAGAGDDMLVKDETYEHFERLVNTNMRFPLFLVKACVPHLRQGSRIVNIGSGAGRQCMQPQFLRSNGNRKGQY